MYVIGIPTFAREATPKLLTIRACRNRTVVAGVSLPPLNIADSELSCPALANGLGNLVFIREAGQNGIARPVLETSSPNYLPKPWNRGG